MNDDADLPLALKVVALEVGFGRHERECANRWNEVRWLLRFLLAGLLAFTAWTAHELYGDTRAGTPIIQRPA